MYNKKVTVQSTGMYLPVESAVEEPKELHIKHTHTHTHTQTRRFSNHESRLLSQSHTFTIIVI